MSAVGGARQGYDTQSPPVRRHQRGWGEAGICEHDAGCAQKCLTTGQEGARSALARDPHEGDT
jgi:hypothetical protein